MPNGVCPCPGLDETMRLTSVGLAEQFPVVVLYSSACLMVPSVARASLLVLSPAACDNLVPWPEALQDTDSHLTKPS